VELELGLMDDAQEKFARALACCTDCNDVMFAIATHGCGVALLSMAKRDLQDGKAGAAYNVLLKGIETCKVLIDRPFICVLKLIGDMYSFGASLPSDLFSSGTSPLSVINDDVLLRRQVEFVAQGHDFYIQALANVTESNAHSDDIRANILSDAGTNLFLQSQLICRWESGGIFHASNTESSKVLDQAVQEYRRALDVSPTCALAWCGLGCALIPNDPLLAQHAFCRAIELDTLFPDPYANLGFLYTSYNKLMPSACVSDKLTEVADTPMMWINRALILEQQYRNEQDSETVPILGNVTSRQRSHLLKEAADAYRAALEVARHPSAISGLAYTCRYGTRDDKHNISMLIESYNHMTEYLGMVGYTDFPSVLTNAVLQMELSISIPTDHSDHLIQAANEQLSIVLQQMEEKNGSDDQNLSSTIQAYRKITEAASSVNESIRPTDDTIDASNDDHQVEIDSWSLHRQVVHSPNRGDVWLELAKHIASNVTNTEAVSLIPALVASRKASSLLMQQLTQTNMAIPTLAQKGKGALQFVKANVVSDALALKYWLETLVDQTNVDGDSGIKSTDDNVNEGKLTNTSDTNSSLQQQSCCSIVDLQRALVINPGNRLAREALKNINNTILD
jgi:tetratricopeptide (TPR) repeat protein